MKKQQNDRAESGGGSSSNSLLWGYGLLTIAVLLLSIDALLILEVSNLGAWTIMFYRYGLMGITIGSYFVVSELGNSAQKFYDIGYIGTFVGLLWGAAGITFTLAILNTHVANVFILMATNPLFSCLFSYLIYGENIPWRTIITVLVCFTAVTVIIVFELNTDIDYGWFGNLMALSAVLLTSMYLVIIRGVNRSRKIGHEREIDFVPCLVVAATLVSVVALSAGADLDLPSVRNMDIVFLILQGVVVLSIGSALLTTATAYVSAPEVSLFMLVDVVLEPIWVWLAGFDTPPYYTIYCGAVVISALLINSILAWYEEKDLAVKVASGEDEVSPLLVPNGGVCGGGK